MRLVADRALFVTEGTKNDKQGAVFRGNFIAICNPGCPRETECKMPVRQKKQPMTAWFKSQYHRPTQQIPSDLIRTKIQCSGTRLDYRPITHQLQGVVAAQELFQRSPTSA